MFKIIKCKNEDLINAKYNIKEALISDKWDKSFNKLGEYFIIASKDNTKEIHLRGHEAYFLDKLTYKDATIKADFSGLFNILTIDKDLFLSKFI